MKKFFNEFKTFAMRGNVLDMAIGVVIGAAFGKITTSVVNDIIMPLIGLITGGIDLTQWNILLNSAAVEAGADILAHPGLIDDQTAAYAAEKGVALELSACPRHGLTNAHVAVMAERHGCMLAPGGNARTPEEFLRLPSWDAVCRGAALSDAARERFRNDAATLVKRFMDARRKTLREKSVFSA